MGDIDEQTVQWLSTMKLGNKLIYLSDFENGYYMGLIFQRNNLAKGRKFKNTKDMALKFQNFKNIRDLLYQNFRIEFPIQNILFNTHSLLMTIRDAIKKYNRDRKDATLKRIQTFSASKIHPNQEKLLASRRNDILSSSLLNQTSKFPKKIQQIEEKLEKYKQIKTKHEIMALEDRRREMEQNRRVIEEHRLYQISKTRTNHQFTKQHQRKVYDVWMKTQQIKKARMEKDQKLQSFMQEKKNKFYQSLRNQEVNSFKEGLQAFQMNCIRQGIELEHDPDKPQAKTQENFNKQVVMERIKDNIKIHDKEHKQRIKRQNKKRVDAQQANEKAQVIWKQNNLVEDYAKKISEHLTICNNTEKSLNREAAEHKIIQKRIRNKSFTQLPQPTIQQQQRRRDEYRTKMIKYRDQQIQRLQARQKKHKIIAENALDALIHVVISNEDNYYANNGFLFSEWKQLQKDFLKFKKKQKKNKAVSRYIDHSYQGHALQYINQEESWKISKKESKQFKVSSIISNIIQKAYPPQDNPSKSDVPLYMPLKIGFIGNKLSGKSILANKIAQKYGVTVIDPRAILNEAFELNKQPVIEDPKKKKDSKKPEQQNPYKIALKQFGQNMMKKLQNPESATINDYIQVIEFYLKANFEQKQGENILRQFQEAKVQETQRYNKAVKQFQDAQKKGKKDSKKPEGDEGPAQKKYFYTKGFILDGIDLNEQNLKKIELKLNGFICFQQKINKKGQQIKQNISSIINIPKAVKDNTLNRGTFDLLINLNCSQEKLDQRQSADKVQLSFRDFTKEQNFYSDFGDQKHQVGAYYVVENNGTVQQCVSQISQLIQTHLDHTYQTIQSYRPSSPPKPEPEIAAQQNIQKQQSKENEVQQKEQKKQVKPQQKKEEVCEGPGIKDLDQVTSEKLVNRLSSILQNYQKNIVQAFTDFDQLRNEFGSNLMGVEQIFVSIINRPDDKAGKVLTFQENYNKLLNQRTNIVKDAQASKHLISKLDELNDSLWSLIENKKNQAVAERQKVLRSTLLNTQIQKVIEVTKNIFQNQLSLLVQIIFFLYNVNSALKGSKEEVPTEYLVLGIPPNIEPIMSFEDREFVSDRLDYYTNQTKACITELPSWLKKKQKKFKITKEPFIEEVLNEFIEKQIRRIYQRLEQVRQKTKELYLQYYCFFRVLTNKMDDWIIQGIKHQNQFIYDIYKNIKKHILNAKKSGIKDLFVKDITEVLHPISSLPLKRFPIVTKTNKNQFKILSFAIFMQQIRCLATGGRIPFKIFKAYIEKRKKSRWLQQEFLQIQLDILQQYLVTDDYCSYKEVALALLLWKTKILDEDAIADYQNQVAGSTQTTGEQSYKYVKEELSFEQFKLIPGITDCQEQARILKTFIFEIFRQEHRDRLIVKEYFDALRMFVQLQVYRYGDTLMILHEAGDKHYQSNK